MCTAINYNERYFGRTLDWEHNFGECVAITPRDFDFKYRFAKAKKHHLAIIGMAKVVDGYPLYFDAANEKGLCMAGLNFTKSAVYPSGAGDMELCPFELIPYVLSECEGFEDAVELLRCVRLADEDFSADLKNARLHWMLSDGKSAVVIEPTENCLTVRQNPIGVLTNEPPIDYHLYNLSSYMSLDASRSENRFAPSLNLCPYSGGLGAFGLPGDSSSASRFVRAAFTKFNLCACGDGVVDFFHILGAVEQQTGGERTQYTSCIDTKEGVYYYKTYENSAITAINMHDCVLDGGVLQSVLLRRSRRQI